jgi:hypothetical protein
MSKSEKELAEFLETASPAEIMLYWRSAAAKNKNDQFIDLFRGPDAPIVLSLSPFSFRALWKTLLRWSRARGRAKRNRRIEQDAAAWRKYWRLTKAVKVVKLRTRI